MKSDFAVLLILLKDKETLKRALFHINTPENRFTEKKVLLYQQKHLLK